MRRGGVGLKAWSLMAAVAIAAVSLAAARAESAPSAGIATIGACASYLSYRRYSDMASRRREGGLTTSRLQKAGLVIGSATFAASVIGLADLAFLIGYYGFLKLAYEIDVRSHWTPYRDSRYMATGVAIGVALALCVASSLRRAFGVAGVRGTPQSRPVASADGVEASVRADPPGLRSTADSGHPDRSTQL